MTLVGYDQLGELSVMCGLMVGPRNRHPVGLRPDGAEIPERLLRAGPGMPSTVRRRRKFINVFLVRPRTRIRRRRSGPATSRNSSGSPPADAGGAERPGDPAAAGPPRGPVDRSGDRRRPDAPAGQHHDRQQRRPRRDRPAYPGGGHAGLPLRADERAGPDRDLDPEGHHPVAAEPDPRHALRRRTATGRRSWTSSG